jgi:hypothetical protein
MNDLTLLRREHTEATQKIAPFTGEGAYHGSTRRRAPSRAATTLAPVVDEMVPATLRDYPLDGSRPIADFEATFSNVYAVERTLQIPSQEEVRDDGVVFCWCPLEDAIAEAGPLTGRVLEAMRELVVGDKRFVYVDSKIQYFEPGDVPVDSQHWHVDGSIVARGAAVEALGHRLLHDMKARLTSNRAPPRYLAYQSSDHCATLFLNEPLTLTMPELVPNFDGLDAAIRALDPPWVSQPPASIVRTDGLSLHRATAASGAGWRLWVRVVETDREVQLDTSIIDCYNTVFRLPR